MSRKVFVFTLIALGALVVATWPTNTSAIDEKAYSIPTMAPLYGAPPNEYRDTWGIKIMFKTTPEVLRDLVPKPLVPNPGNNMYVTIRNLFTKGIGTYGELMLVAPAIFEGRPVDFCVYVLASNEADNASGREIWGFPQKWGRIKLEEKNGVVTGIAERAGIILVKASVALSALAKLEADNPPIVNLKLIPSVRENAPPEVKQLTSTTLQNFKVNRAYSGMSILEFGASPVDPFHKIPIKEVQLGHYIELDFTLTYGEVIHDYPKAK